MKLVSSLRGLVLCSACAGAGPLAAAPRGMSDFGLVAVQGTKFPNSPSEGRLPVRSEAFALSPAALAAAARSPLVGDSGARNYALIPFVLASPDQEDAGSCLYMSLTGIAEWWLATLNPGLPRTAEGPLDLSERYMMNLAGTDEDKDTRISNWKTDSVELFNQEHRSVRNSSYRFTKGWYVLDDQGSPHPAARGSVGALYDTSYNWIDDRASITGGYVPLPTFTRNVLFADPESNQWNVGVAPVDLVDRVKTALDTNRAPVHVIYNHMGYWHAVVIVGYDDAVPNAGCPFVKRSLNYLSAEPALLRREAAAATEEKDRAALLARADRAQLASDKLAAAYADKGGCHGDKGAFLVRDSIYSAASEPVYHYDFSDQASDGHYSQKIITHEYDWLLYLVNHAVQIGVSQGSAAALSAAVTP